MIADDFGEIARRLSKTEKRYAIWIQREPLLKGLIPKHANWIHVDHNVLFAAEDGLKPTIFEAREEAQKAIDAWLFRQGTSGSGSYTVREYPEG